MKKIEKFSEFIFEKSKPHRRPLPISEKSSELEGMKIEIEISEEVVSDMEEAGVPKEKMQEIFQSFIDNCTGYPGRDEWTGWITGDAVQEIEDMLRRTN